MAQNPTAGELSEAYRAPVAQRTSLLGSKRFRDLLSRTLSTFLVAFGAVLIMVPVVWMISTSLKGESNVLAIPPEWIPLEPVRVEIDGKNYFLYDVTIDGQTQTLAAIKLNPEKSIFVDPANPTVEIYAPSSAAVKTQQVKIHWENYQTVWNYGATPFALFMQNTIIYALLAVIGEVLSCSLVAFGFARLRAPGKNFLFLLVLATMMLPWAVLMIPQYVLFTNHIPAIINGIFGTNIKLADTWWPLWIPKFFGSAYLIFLVRQFYMGIPKDYDDAARIDGCGYFQTWWRIIIPMSRPVLTAVAILSFMFHWNDYMGPLIYLNSTDKLPLSVGLAQFQVAYGGTPYHLMMAAALISVAPLVLIFFALNRYFVQGVVVSGVKG